MNRAVAATPTGRAERLNQRKSARSRGRQSAIEARRRQKNTQRGIVAGVALLVLAIGGYFAYAAITREELGETFQTSGVNEHVAADQTVSDYNSNPPTSGLHWSTIGPWGVQDAPVANEQQVHNMEHGGVVIQYDAATLPADALQDLKDKVNEIPTKVVLAPREGMDSPIALTSWGRMLKLQAYDEAQIDGYIDLYIDKGPEKIQAETQLLERWRERRD